MCVCVCVCTVVHAIVCADTRSAAAAAATLAKLSVSPLLRPCAESRERLIVQFRYYAQSYTEPPKSHPCSGNKHRPIRLSSIALDTRCRACVRAFLLYCLCKRCAPSSVSLRVRKRFSQTSVCVCVVWCGEDYTVSATLFIYIWQRVWFHLHAI